MNIFPKKLSTKKLNIKEMWQVYGLLKSGLPKKEEEYLLHEIIKIMEGISTENFKQSLIVMGIPESENSIKVIVPFVNSLKTNEFFSFVRFISGMNNGNR